jgi:O-antigen ligase
MMRLAPDHKRLLIRVCLLTPALYLPGILLGFRYYFLGLALSLIAALVMIKAVPRALPTGFGRIGWALGLWLGINFISATWAGNVEATLIASSYLLILAIFWLSGAAVALNASPVMQVKFFAFSTVASALVFTYVLLAYGSVRPLTEEVARVFGAGANAGAMHAVVALPMLIWRMQLKRSLSSVLLVLLAFVIVGMSQSRAAYLSIAVGCMLWAVLHQTPRYTRGARLLFGLAVVSVLVLLAFAVVPQTMLRLTNVGRAFSDPTVLVADGQGDFSRLATYYFGWLAFKESPWLGIGYRNLEPFMEDKVGFGEASHNLIVTLLAETGVPGTVAFIALMVIFFRTVRQAVAAAPTRDEANWRIAVGIAMVVALLSGMFHQVPEFQYFYLLLGLTSSWQTAQVGKTQTAPANVPLRRKLAPG